MNPAFQPFLRRVSFFLGLALAISATGAEASSAPGRVYAITVAGIAYSVTSNRDQVTIAAAGEGATVILAAGQISLSSVADGAPGPAAAVMNDPARAQVVNHAVAMAVAALAVVAGGAAEPELAAKAAAIELQRTLDLLMQAVPSHAAAVIESAAHAVPEQEPCGLLVGAAVTAAITSGMPAELAGETMAAAAARGAVAADPSRAHTLAHEIAHSAVLAAIKPGWAKVRAKEIVRAVARGATSGAIQGFVIGRMSAVGTDAKLRGLVSKVEQISKYVAQGASSAVQELYGTNDSAVEISQSAVSGVESGAKHGITVTDSKIGSVRFDYARITQASIAGSLLTFALVGTPGTPIDPGGNVSPSH